MGAGHFSGQRGAHPGPARTNHRPHTQRKISARYTPENSYEVAIRGDGAIMVTTMDTRVITIDSPDHVGPAARKGAAALRAGKLVAFATETVYGLAAVADNAEAMERLRELKARPKRPFTVHVSGAEAVKRYVSPIPSEARRLIARAWPGPVTLLLPTGGELAEAALQEGGLHSLLCSENIIGLRCPDEPVALAMLGQVTSPVVAPSANLAGEPSPRTAREVLASLDGQIDLVLDSGPTQLGADSTIVKFDQANWRIVRAGPWDEKDVRRAIKRTFAFVCTGNTCRSPMAAGLAKVMLAQMHDCRVGELRSRGINVVSAGVSAYDGARATTEAVHAAKVLGADIARHRSRALDMETVDQADTIFCMTQHHADHIRRAVPELAEKIKRLDLRADIPDPIGGGLEVYRHTAERIVAALRDSLDKELS